MIKNKTQHVSLAKNIYICRDTIFNDPWMTLGSYIKGPNSMMKLMNSIKKYSRAHK